MAEFFTQNLSDEKNSLNRIISKYTRIHYLQRYILFVWNQLTSVNKVNTNIKNINFQTALKKHAVYPFEGRNFHPHLTAIIQRKPHKQPATLIKEKIELPPIQPISCSIWGYYMTIGIVSIILYFSAISMISACPCFSYL